MSENPYRVLAECLLPREVAENFELIDVIITEDSIDPIWMNVTSFRKVTPLRNWCLMVTRRPNASVIFRYRAKR